MSHCLSHTALYTPNLSSSRSSHLRRPQRNFLKFPIRATAEDDGESLDHVQAKKKKTAPLGLWDRFPTARTVQEMVEEMKRMMEDPSSTWHPPIPLTDAVTYGPGRTPWEMIEGEEEFRLRFDMPGMTKEDVKVCVEDKLLVVKAEKRSKKPPGDEDEVHEFEDMWPTNRYGKYRCTMALPEGFVKLETITAEVKDGVLYVNIPKPSCIPKVFEISVS